MELYSWLLDCEHYNKETERCELCAELCEDAHCPLEDGNES